MVDAVTPEAMDELFGSHMEAEMNADLVTTLATMSSDPHIFNGPTMIGGEGQGGVRSFYADHLIGQFFPPDVTFTTVSRTHGASRLVDELVISFTHTRKIDWMLPGIAPTGKKVSVIFVVIVGVKDAKVQYEHIYWDQASVLAQLGLLDGAGLPVAGAEAAAHLLHLASRG
jgi:carboxymethylenebutenolidase